MSPGSLYFTNFILWCYGFLPLTDPFIWWYFRYQSSELNSPQLRGRGVLPKGQQSWNISLMKEAMMNPLHTSASKEQIYKRHELLLPQLLKIYWIKDGCLTSSGLVERKIWLRCYPKQMKEKKNKSQAAKNDKKKQNFQDLYLCNQSCRSAHIFI